MNAHRWPTAALVAALATAGCSHTLENLCENCGVIRKITPRTVEGEPFADLRRGPGGIASFVPGGASAGSRSAAHTVYHVAVRMDWGGVSYYTVGSVDGLRPGDRVEVRFGEIVPLHRDRAMP